METIVGHTTSLRLLDAPDRPSGRGASLPARHAWRSLQASSPSRSDLERIRALSGMWNAAGDGPPVDILVGRHAQRGRLPDVRYHVWGDAVPPRSFVRADDGILLSTPEFSLLQMAAYLPREIGVAFSEKVLRGRRPTGLDDEEVRRLANSSRTRARRIAMLRLIWLANGLCGTYGLFDDVPSPTAGMSPREAGDFRRRARLTDGRRLLAYAHGAVGLPGATLLEQAIGHVGNGSASPMEAAVAMILFLPSSLGGYGIGSPSEGPPVRNHRVARPGYRRYDPRNLPDAACYVIDLAFPVHKLAIEYNGRPFHSGDRRRSHDESRRNDLTRMGWTVVFITFDQLKSTAATDSLAKVIASQLGMQVRIRRGDFRTRQAELRSVVLPKLACACPPDTL